MKEEYMEIFISLFVWLVLLNIFYLVVDLFVDGFFIVGMIVSLLWLIPMHIIVFLIKAFQLNYKIIKREE